MHMICNSTDAERPISFCLAIPPRNAQNRPCFRPPAELGDCQPWAKPDFDRPPGREQILNTSTGDKSPVCLQVVPLGHTGIATALNAEMSKLQSPSGQEASRPSKDSVRDAHRSDNY